MSLPPSKYDFYPYPDPTGVKPSHEQENIMNNFELGYNVIIKSVAGSGKTTLCLQLGRILATQGRRAMFITYSKALQMETDKRSRNMGLTSQLEVRTFHSACSKLYGVPNVSDDIKFNYAVHNYMINDATSRSYNVLIVDEAQDMNDDYVEFVRRVAHGKQVVMVGDPRQCINHFNGANSAHFLTFPGVHGGAWVECFMRTSYRLTPKMADFVERALGESFERRIVGGNSRSPDQMPYYINVSNPKDRAAGKYIAAIIMDCINRDGPESTVLIANTVKDEFMKNSITGLVKEELDLLLYDKGLCSYTKDNDKPYDAQYTQGKFMFVTFNAMKGMEKKNVFVFIDDYYRMRYTPELTKGDPISNVGYVALTRAISNMYVIQPGTHGPIAPLTKKDIEETCDTTLNRIIITNKVNQEYKISMLYRVSVLKSLDYRDVKDKLSMMKYIRCTHRQSLTGVDLSNIISIPYNYDYTTMNGDHRKGEGKTSVLRYYGTLISIYVEYARTKDTTSIYGKIDDYIQFICSTVDSNKNERDGQFTYHRVMGVQRSDLNVNLINKIMLETIPAMKRKNVAEHHRKLENLITKIYCMCMKDGKVTDLNVVVYLILAMDIRQNSPNDCSLIVDENKPITWFNNSKMIELSNLCNWFLTNDIAASGATGTIELYEKSYKKNYIHDYITKYGHIPDHCIEGRTIELHPTSADRDLYAYMANSGITVEGGRVYTNRPSLLEYGALELNGRADLVTKNRIYEFKVSTSDDMTDHVLQLATYLSMSDIQNGVLVNFGTGTVCDVEVTNKKRFLQVLISNVKNWEYLKQDPEVSTISNLISNISVK